MSLATEHIKILRSPAPGYAKAELDEKLPGKLQTLQVLSECKKYPCVEGSAPVTHEVVPVIVLGAKLADVHAVLSVGAVHDK